MTEAPHPRAEAVATKAAELERTTAADEVASEFSQSHLATTPLQMDGRGKCRSS